VRLPHPMPQPLVTLSDFNLKAVCALNSWPPADWSNVTPLPLQQAWLPAAEIAFLPAQVWLAATHDSFAIIAELEDHDIATAAQTHNDPLWDLGDVFEIFVRHTARPEYFEFHIAPNNVTLDLRYPKLYASRADGVELYMLTEPHFSAQAVCLPSKKLWRVAACLPVANLVTDESLVAAPSVWQFSFCRYDCGPNRGPAVSSTSPHKAAGFHRAEEWLTFLAPPFDIR